MSWLRQHSRIVVVFAAALWLGLEDRPLQAQPDHPEFLIANWLSNEGIPENSAITVTQTRDGYLWIGSVGGLLRFNGQEFVRAASRTDLRRLGQVVFCVKADRTGRLWVSTEAGHALLDQGGWQRLEGPIFTTRSIAEGPDGQVYFGSADGRLFVVEDRKLRLADAPPGLLPSGVFCCTDQEDGSLWVANRGFIGKLTPQGWKRFGPSQAMPDSAIAAPARGGGLWVYSRAELSRYRDSSPPRVFRSPSIAEPREIHEDRFGTIWIASNFSGLVYLTPGDEQAATITTANGLAHNTTRCIFEDTEGSLWVGTSNGGLHRLRRRQFLNIGVEQGLPDRIVRTVIEEAPGRMLVGTHGGGTARIENDQVTWIHPVSPTRKAAYAWSVLRDQSGRIWTGTFRDGLLVETNGEEHQLAWPKRFDQISPNNHTVYGLFEDRQHQIWVGTVAGLGVIESNRLRPWSADTNFMPYAVHCIAEDPKAPAIWIGTYSRGLFRLRGDQFTQYGRDGANRLPGDRISSVFVDQQGWVWAGVFGQGLVCLRDDRLTRITSAQGLPAETIGSVVEDGLGYFWLGSNRGILRVSCDELRAVVEGRLRHARFLQFDRSDGVGTADCSEGYQPTATRDRAGRLWFATLKGVVRVDPVRLVLNTNPPPVVIERLSFTDRRGTNHTVHSPSEKGLELPAGSTDLQVQFAALSFAAPEKSRRAYRLAGVLEEWKEVAGWKLDFHTLRPRSYCLQIKAANNDGVWNDSGATLEFTVLPFFWQTLGFRLLTVIGLLAGVGLAGWRLARSQLRHQIQRLQQERTVERERGRLAAVMQAASDLVVFADREGNLLHLNPAGERLLGFSENRHWRGMKLADLYPPAAREILLRETIPTAIREGLCQGDTRVLIRDGREIPVSQVLVAHRDPDGSVTHLSAILRDILDRKRAEDALRESEEKLRAILQAAPVGIGVVANHVFVEVNAHLAGMTGYPREELLGAKARVLYLTEEDFELVGDESSLQLGEHGMRSVETRWKRKDGTCIEVLLSSMPISASEGPRGVTVTAVDITERKQAEARQQRAATQAVQAQLVLLQLAKLDAGDLESYLRQAMELGASVLEVPRASVWRMRPDGEEIVSADVYDRAAASHRQGERLSRAEHPKYFAALEGNRVIAASEARQDPRAAEFCADYLVPTDVFSLLDVPIRRGGKVVGVVCFEQTGAVRPWDPQEQEFAVSFADALAVAFEAHDRRRAETALRTKTEELDRYFTSSLDLLCIADTEGHFRRLNPAWTQALGYSLDQLRSRRFLEFVHPDDLAATLETLARLDQQQEVLGFQNRFRHQNGSYHWLEWRSYPQGNLIYATARDITEHKRTEDVLQTLATSFLTTSTEEFATKVSQYLAGTLQVEFAFVGEPIPGTNRVRVVGGSALDRPMASFEYDLAGTPCERVLGRSFYACPAAVQAQFPNDVRLAERKIEGYAGIPLFDRAQKPLGILGILSTRPLGDTRFAATLLKLFAGRVEAELEGRRAEAEKERLQAQLLQAHKMESVGRLAGGVAHDFNNMLQVILGNASLALSQVQPGDPVHEDLLEIQKSALRSADLTRQLLAFARKQTINPRILNLNETVSGMLKMLQRLMGEDIQLTWRPASGLWPVNIDPAQVDQILANLAANARDAIRGTGAVTIETANVSFDEAHAKSHPDCVPGGYVMLALTDTGHGMSPEVLDHLFEPFFTTKDVGKGTGLGLATVFGIIKQNGGFITVESEPNQGTTFKVFLRRAESPAHEAAKGVAALPRRGTETILLVEDEPQVLNLGERILRQQGYTVLIARSPEEAVSIAAQHAGKIHLLITDVIMPGMNGRDLRDTLHTTRPDMRCLFMSGYTASVIAQHGVLDEGLEFLQKPFTLEALSQKARQVLDRRVV